MSASTVEQRSPVHVDRYYRDDLTGDVWLLAGLRPSGRGSLFLRSEVPGEALVRRIRESDLATGYTLSSDEFGR